MTVSTEPSPAAEIRRHLQHPIIDCDGHVLEISTVFIEYLREHAGSAIADSYVGSPAYQHSTAPWLETVEKRRPTWTSQSNLWGTPTKNTLDRATATIPALYAERMERLGIDFSILYPSAGLSIVLTSDPEVREAVVRAYNAYAMMLSRPFPDKLMPVAMIPMTTPDEAIRQLDYAVREVGHKVVCLQGYVFRPLQAVEEVAPTVAQLATRLDYFGLDSEYDYDPVWAKCLELGVAPTFHSKSGLKAGRSLTNYTYNHIGSVAQAQDGLAKALLLGGVTRRFPGLNFGFLECGVGWACTLYSEIIGHYRKRNLRAMDYVDPKHLNVDDLMGFLRSYGDSFTLDHLDEARAFFERPSLPLPERDDFWQMGVSDAREVSDLFVPHFYFGCEADDLSVAWAFDRDVNPYGASLRAMFGSDVGHWDVVDVADVLVEAWELVERGNISEEDFEDFAFSNAVKLHGGVNPEIFAGTQVEAAAKRVIDVAYPQP